MKAITVVLFLFCNFKFAYSDSHKSWYVEALLRSHSPSDLKQIKENYQELKSSQVSCLYELREQLLPLHCYKKINLEKSIGIKNSYLELTRELDQICERWFRLGSKVPKNLNQSRQFVSLNCLHSITQGQKISDYKSGEYRRLLNKMTRH